MDQEVVTGRTNQKIMELKICAHIQTGSQKDDKEIARASQKQERAAHFARYANSIVQESAANGDVASAERWMDRVCSNGTEPEIESFNALLRAMSASKEFERAEGWFKKALHKFLHPELRGLKPDAMSYNIMVEAFAAAGDVPKAECYAGDALDLAMNLSRKSYDLLVDACLNCGEVRRAQRWLDMMLAAGFTKPRKESVRRLICGLADAGTVESAEKWLAFMADEKQPMDSDTYEHVRSASPMEILPCNLSGEFEQLRAPGIRPVKLKGEEVSVPDGVRPKREAHRFLPPRSARAAAAKWPPTVVADVQQQATKNMPSGLKKEFFKTYSIGRQAPTCPEFTSSCASPKTPRRRYLGPTGNYVQFSHVASTTLPPRSEIHQPTVGDPHWHPYWLDSGPPPIAFQRLQYGAT